MMPSGRGAAMQRFLAAMQEEKERSGQSTEQSQSAPVRPVGRGIALVSPELEEGIKEIAIARPNGRGRGLQTIPPETTIGKSSFRGETFQHFAESREKSPEVVRPVGRGRSSVMATFLAQQQSSETVPGKWPFPSLAKPEPYTSERVMTSSSKVAKPEPYTSERVMTSSSKVAKPEPYTSERVMTSSSKVAKPEHYTSEKVMTSISKITQSTPESPEESRYCSQPVVQHGSHGPTLETVCNYIQLDVAPGKGVFSYTVEFFPSEDNLSMKNRMINQHLDRLGGVKSYNGTKLLLSIKLNEVTSFDCEHPQTRAPITMKLNYKGPTKERDAADLYNGLFRRIMSHLGLKNMGRKFFDPSGAVTIPQHRLEVWPGYVTSVQQFEGGIKLCCDASHRVMRTESALEVMENLARVNPQKYREDTLKMLLGAVVLTRYNNRVYKIDDISWNQSPLSTFVNSDGEELSFFNYYKTHYDIEINDKNQPLLISRIERKKELQRRGVEEEVRMICLVPELCYITGLTDAIKSDFRIMKDLTAKLQLTPLQRYEGLTKFLRNIAESKNSQDLLMKWGLQVAHYPVKLMARVVQAETILHGDGQTELPPGNSNWVINNTLFAPRDIQHWAILHTPQDYKVAQDFESNMRKACAQMGMKVYSGKLVRVNDNRNETLLHTLRATVIPTLQFVVIFFSSLRADRYAAVKKVCCIEQPIPSQVIQARTLSRPDKARSITKKIAMQINCKLGGALWGLRIPYEKLMVCGMDVYHSTASKSSSVMGFVATSDPQQVTWYSRVGFGKNHQEVSENLRMCLGGALRKYKEVSGFYPDRIIMFRDGVGDGQLNATKEFEVPQMLQSFNDINVNFKPKLTFVVCQKRILTRIMSVQGGSGPKTKLQNAPSGTVLDHTITRYDWYDFFLVSQSSNRGTVSPTHYIVVYDDGQIKPDHIQRMTYKMTHLYYNWTGTISVPAPAQYAHRLAQLVGLHLRKEPSATLNDKLFFL